MKEHNIKKTNRMRTLLIACLFSLQVVFSYGQKRISIYELGDSLIDCETNFRNLFSNWTSENVTNANSYKLLKYSFVETITDSTRFKYYRNYFSGVEPIYSSTKGISKESSNGQRTNEFYIKPGFIHKEIFDQRGIPEKHRELFSEEFKLKAMTILTQKINIDTMNLNYYSYEMNGVDKLLTLGHDFNVYSVRNLKGASLDSISKNYIDIFIKGEKSIEDLNIKEKRSLMLEQFIIERINNQLLFNKHVQIGDKVYIVDFEYDEQLFTNYVICSAENKKVIMDYFFSEIRLELENN
jgi:hypothetical protein